MENDSGNQNNLDFAADIFMLLTVSMAAIGHVLPWFGRPTVEQIDTFQLECSGVSAIALAVSAIPIGFSVIFYLGPMMRRLVNLAIFGSVFIALLYEILQLSFYAQWGWGGRGYPQISNAGIGFHLAWI